MLLPSLNYPLLTVKDIERYINSCERFITNIKFIKQNYLSISAFPLKFLTHDLCNYHNLKVSHRRQALEARFANERLQLHQFYS